MSDELKKLLPAKTLERWHTWNCADCDALQKALADKAEFKNLRMHTMQIDRETGTMKDFERCRNCKITTKGIKTTSDPKK